MMLVDSNIRDLLAIFVIVAILAIFLGAMMLEAQREQRAVEKAQDLIANPPRLPPGGERVFRKPKLSAYMLILLFIFMFGMAAYSVIHPGGSFSNAAPGAATVALLAFVPLFRGIRILRYTVRLSNDELIICDFKTKSVPVRDIGEVTITVARASSFCRIRLMTGEEDLNVASDLQSFPEFVSLLSEKVNAPKTHG